MVSVRGQERNIAVLKKESALLRNVVVLEDIRIIRQLDEQAITIDDCVVDEDVKEFTQAVKVTVNNSGPDSLIHSIQWQVDPTRYTITPSEMPLAIASEEVKEYMFNVTVMNGSDLFPMPSFTLAYPFTYGKVCTLYNLLSVKRHKFIDELTFTDNTIRPLRRQRRHIY
jgi:hypothetical protein